MTKTLTDVINNPDACRTQEISLAEIELTIDNYLRHDIQLNQNIQRINSQPADELLNKAYTGAVLYKLGLEVYEKEIDRLRVDEECAAFASILSNDELENYEATKNESSAAFKSTIDTYKNLFIHLLSDTTFKTGTMTSAENELKKALFTYGIKNSSAMGNFVGDVFNAAKNKKNKNESATVLIMSSTDGEFDVDNYLLNAQQLHKLCVKNLTGERTDQIKIKQGSNERQITLKQYYDKLVEKEVACQLKEKLRNLITIPQAGCANKQVAKTIRESQIKALQMAARLNYSGSHFNLIISNASQLTCNEIDLAACAILGRERYVPPQTSDYDYDSATLEQITKKDPMEPIVIGERIYIGELPLIGTNNANNFTINRQAITDQLKKHTSHLTSGSRVYFGTMVTSSADSSGHHMLYELNYSNDSYNLICYNSIEGACISDDVLNIVKEIFGNDTQINSDVKSPIRQCTDTGCGVVYLANLEKAFQGFYDSLDDNSIWSLNLYSEMNMRYRFAKNMIDASNYTENQVYRGQVPDFLQLSSGNERLYVLQDDLLSISPFDRLQQGESSDYKSDERRGGERSTLQSTSTPIVGSSSFLTAGDTMTAAPVTKQFVADEDHRNSVNHNITQNISSSLSASQKGYETDQSIMTTPTNIEVETSPTIGQTGISQHTVNSEQNGAQNRRDVSMLAQTQPSPVRELKQYVETRFIGIDQCVNAQFDSVNSARSKMLKSTATFKNELLSQIEELSREEVEINNSSEPTMTEVRRSEVWQRFNERFNSLNNYVRDVLPPYQPVVSQSPRLENLIATPNSIREANETYIKKQPSLSRKQKALRLAGFALAFGIAAVAIAAGVTLCVASAGAATPVVAAATAPVIAALGGASGAIAAGGSISVLGGVIGFFASKGSLKTEEQEKAKELTDDASYVAKLGARHGGG